MASEESSAAINGDDLRTGDHVYTWRAAGYGHHGIFVGDGMIIEFTTGDALKTISSSVVSKGSGAVGMCNWKSFRGTGSLYRYEYGVSEEEFKERHSGTCTTANADAPELVKHRAYYLLYNGYGTYNLFTHNCEDFALYCKTGLVVPEGSVGSSQGANLLVSTIENIENSFNNKYGGLGAAHAIIFSIFGFGAFSRRISGSGDFDPEYRYLMDIGVRSDTVRIEVENLVRSQGEDNNLEENMRTRIIHGHGDGVPERRQQLGGAQEENESSNRSNHNTMLTIIAILLATIFFSQRAYN